MVCFTIPIRRHCQAVCVEDVVGGIMIGGGLEIFPEGGLSRRVLCLLGGREREDCPLRDFLAEEEVEASRLSRFLLGSEESGVVEYKVWSFSLPFVVGGGGLRSAEMKEGSEFVSLAIKKWV